MLATSHSAAGKMPGHNFHIRRNGQTVLPSEVKYPKHTVGYVVSSVVTKRQSLTNSWMNGLKWIKGRSTNVRIEVKWFCVRIWLWIPVLSLAGCYIKLPSSGSQLSRLLSSDAGTLGWSDPVSHDCGSFVECGPTIMPHSPAKPIFRLHVISSVHTHTHIYIYIFIFIYLYILKRKSYIYIYIYIQCVCMYVYLFPSMETSIYRCSLLVSLRRTSRFRSTLFPSAWLMPCPWAWNVALFRRRRKEAQRFQYKKVKRTWKPTNGIRKICIMNGIN